MAGFVAARHIYDGAVDTAATLWDAAKNGDRLDAGAAVRVARSLSQLLARDPVALMALTAAPGPDTDGHDTLTHMVNVAALTMALAATVNIDGPVLEAFGVAGLMHDIGKVHTPPEVLHKPETLTSEEFAIIKRHVLDGAAILRRTPGMTPLAPVVAFEHHLKQDLSGYPENVGVRQLNLCTLIVSIADVFDALRSDRPYRQGLATSRIRAIMEERDSPAFHRPLLMRFVGLMGLFPVGSLVRLETGELGVVTAERPDNPLKPQVTVIATREGAPLDAPVTVRTWEPDADGEYTRNIAEAVDPGPLGIDPLSYL